MARLAADPLGEGSEEHAAGERAHVVQDGDGAGELGRKAMVLLQEGGIEILGSMGEGVEAGHEEDEEEEGSAIAQHAAHGLAAGPGG